MVTKEKNKKLGVAVLLGGDSPERDVSIASGSGIVKALRNRGHAARPVDPALPREEQYEVEEASIDIKPPAGTPLVKAEEALNWLEWDQVREADLVFIALHGGKGENGVVQALLEAAGLIYTGAGVLGSAIAMDKDRSKALMREAGVSTAEHVLFERVRMDRDEAAGALIGEEIGYPLVVKPNSQGSSVGFSFVDNPNGLNRAVARGFEFDEELIIERYVKGRELTVAVLGDRPLTPVEIIPEGGFYNYKCKYTKGCSEYVVPARIEPETARKLKEDAITAFRALRCRDYARVDFRVDQDGMPYCLELNTLPGMTELSLVPMAAADAGLSFDELIEKICFLALSRSGGGGVGRRE